MSHRPRVLALLLALACLTLLLGWSADRPAPAAAPDPDAAFDPPAAALAQAPGAVWRVELDGAPPLFLYLTADGRGVHELESRILIGGTIGWDAAGQMVATPGPVESHGRRKWLQGEPRIGLGPDGRIATLGLTFDPPHQDNGLGGRLDLRFAEGGRRASGSAKLAYLVVSYGPDAECGQDFDMVPSDTWAGPVKATRIR